MYGVDLMYIDEVFLFIVCVVVKRGTGVRGLRTFFERLFIDVMFEVFDDLMVFEVFIDGESVEVGLV